MTPTFASSSSCGSPRLVNDDHGDRVVVVVVRLDHHHHGVVDTASRSRRVAVQVPSSLNVVPTTCIYMYIYILGCQLLGSSLLYRRNGTIDHHRHVTLWALRIFIFVG